MTSFAINPINVALSLSQEVYAGLSPPPHHVTKNSQADRRVNTFEEDVIFPSLPPLHHGSSDIHLRNGIMNASRLATAHVPDAEKAFFVADLCQVYQQYKRWESSLPEIMPFYAVKCNPDPYIIRLLAALGIGFDCASNNEISQILSLGGVEPCNIIYANPCKAMSFIRNAQKAGVHMTTFDNSDELYKISRAHPAAKCVIRILTDDSKSLCAFGIKFGASLFAVPGLLAKAKELDLDVIGVSFHVGSGCYDPTVYMDAIHRARLVFDLGKDAGYNFHLLDIGGGFEDELFEQAANLINVSLERYFPDRRNLKIIAEPGRFFVSRSFKLATHIIARRSPLERSPMSDSSDRPAAMYYINDGVYGSFNCIFLDHQVVHPYVLFMKGSFHIAEDEETHLCSVWGPTCDSIDCVSQKTTLPTDLQVGDWLGFDNMGAYTTCAATQFNGFEISPVIYTIGGAEAVDVRNILARYAAQGHGL